MLALANGFDLGWAQKWAQSIPLGIAFIYNADIGDGLLSPAL